MFNQKGVFFFHPNKTLRQAFSAANSAWVYPYIYKYNFYEFLLLYPTSVININCIDCL